MSIEMSRIIFIGGIVLVIAFMYWFKKLDRTYNRPVLSMDDPCEPNSHESPHELTDEEIFAFPDEKLTVLGKFRKHIRHGQTVTSTIYFHTYPAEGCEIVRVSFSIRRAFNTFFCAVSLQNQFGSYTQPEMEVNHNDWFVAFNRAFVHSGLFALKNKPLPYTGDMMSFINGHIQSWPLVPIVHAIKNEVIYESII